MPVRPTVRVLGALEAAIDERPVDLGGPKPRLVLAILVAARGEAVSMDRLVDGLWSDEPPARAEASVQSYVSNLRRALDPDRPKGTPSDLLPTTPAGYRLAVDDLDLDAHRFAELADEGHDLLDNDPGAALTALAEALALWRGPAYGDASDNPLLLADAARLDELRWRATEDRWTAELALGRHERAIPELRALTQQAPLRERTWILLATALARSGRKVDALRAVHDGIDLLADETGLDPGPELRALETSLLADYDQPTPSPPIATSPAPTLLVARQDELAVLTDALAGAGTGRGRTVVVSGEPGIGKTHLVRALADESATQGWAVAWGRCPEGSDVTGFWPLQESLTTLARQVDASDPRDLAPPGANIGPLLPGAEESTGHVTTTFAVATAFVEVLRAVSQERPLLLVIDDAHWADAGTLRVLRHLVSEMHNASVLVVITHRDVDPAQRQLLAPLRDDIARSRDGRALDLVGLDVAAVESLLAESGDDTLTEAEAQELQRRTGGNPFFIRELARSGGGDTPAGVRDAIRRRLDALDPDARRALDALAVAGEQADAHLLAAAAGLDTAAVLDALDAAATGGLVAEDTTPGRYRLAHDLIRETAYDDLTPAARARLHHAIGTAIEARWGDDPAHLPARAWHLWKGVAAGDPDHVLDVVSRAASLADTTDRLDEAVQRWRWAEELLEVAGSPDTRATVLSSLGHALLRAGDVTASRPVIMAAARLAQQRGDWDDVADLLTATSELSLWVTTPYGEVDDERLALLEETLTHVADDDRRRAAVAGRIAVELYYTDDEERIDRYSDEAIRLARTAGDDRLLAVVLSQVFATHQRSHLSDRLIELADELRTVSAESEIAPGELEAITSVMTAYARLSLGQLDDAATEMASADRHAASGRLPYLAGQLRWYQLTRLILAGHLDAAEAAWEETSAFYARVGGIEPESVSLLAMVGLRMEQGRSEELLDTLHVVITMGGRPADAWSELLLVALLDAGRDDEARAWAVDHPRQRFAHDFIWLSNTCTSAWARARLGDVEACRVLLDELLPYTGQVVLTGQLPPAYGAADFFVGVLAAATGDDDLAETHLRQAVALNEKLGARAWLARSLDALASAIDRRTPGGEEAADLRARARHLADQVGNPRLVRQLTAD